MSNKTLSQKTVKTRKQHRCWGCTKIYPVGSYMYVVNEVEGDKVHSVYWCEVCQEYIARYDRFDDGDYGHGDLYLNDPDGWNEIQKEMNDKLNEKTKIYIKAEGKGNNGRT